jgi:predicted nucleic acid-binding protein
VIYLDTSVALAQLLAEDRQPPPEFWGQDLVSSRLIEHELWCRIHARDLGRTHGDAVRRLVARVARVELIPDVLERSLAPFPTPVRTLDALHLATATWLIERGHDVRLATYDERMARAASALGITLYE